MIEDISESLSALIDEFKRSGVRELHVRRGAFELYLSNDAGAGRVLQRGRVGEASLPTPASEQPAPAASSAAAKQVSPRAADIPADAIVVCAPNLGTFYRAPKPGAANYVEVGDSVVAGDELCLIEVMKLFTALRSDVVGVVHAVLVDDGVMVEAGQPLFAIMRA